MVFYSAGSVSSDKAADGIALPSQPKKRLSAVVPCYNEEGGLPELVRRLSAACSRCVGADYEIVLVNDGSHDGTWQQILRQSQEYKQIVGVNLARNHGHQLALTAGLYIARGQRILIIDADLQDPPELLPEMMKRLDDGAHVAYGRRIEREGETWFKRTTAMIFYRLLSRLTHSSIPADTGDFRLMDRRVLNVLLNMPEQHRFVRGMIAWIGFQQVAVDYKRQPRIAGRSNYPFTKMLTFAADAVTGFSVTPLRISFYIGLTSVGLAFILSLYILFSWFELGAVPGWASITLIMLTFGSLQMLCLGIIGEYLGRTYLQTKQRPLFIIESIHQDSDERNGT
jgi:polyisoprenyl-phosphate glycosyltransferase